MWWPPQPASGRSHDEDFPRATSQAATTALEHAAAREVREETGVEVAAVSRMHSSQPWPVGRALSCELMVGLRCVAAAATPPSVDTAELEAARWFTRDEVRAGLAASAARPADAVWFPGPYAIANALIVDFLQDGDDCLPPPPSAGGGGQSA